MLIKKKKNLEAEVVVQTCHLSTQEGKVGGSQVQG
jgi:hypothetical protein